VIDPAAEPTPVVPLEHPDTPRRILPIARLGAFVEVLLCSGFPTQLLLIGMMTSFGMRMHDAEGRLSPAFVFTLSFADTILVIGLILFFIRGHGESVKDVFFARRPVLREALLGIALTPVVFMLVLLILALLLTFAPDLHNVPRNPLEDMLQTRRDSLVFSVVVLVAGGVREEVQRGFVLHRFDRYLGGGLVGMVVFSALFGLGHIDQGFDAAIATATLGAAWGCLYLLRRSIVAPMVSHAGFNLAQLIRYLVMAG
jgi:membrane protease YdiL (CAAX protease family)